MTDGHAESDYGDLEAALFDLADHLEYPAPRRLGSPVRTQLAQGQPHSVSFRARLKRTVVIPTLATLLAIASLLALSPGVRSAVASWLRLPGVIIRVGAPPGPIGKDLRLGKPITLGEAGRRLPFRPLIPTLRNVGDPDSVYLTESRLAGRRLTLVYAARDGLRPVSGRRIGALLTEFQAETDGPLLEKVVASGSQVEQVTVSGNPGWWVHGKAHYVVYRRGAEVFPDTLRLSGNALLWQQGDVTLRLESSLSKGKMLRLARSFQPISQ